MAIDKKQISQYTLYFIVALMITAVTLLSNLPSKKTIGKLWEKFAECNKRINNIEARMGGFDVGHDNVSEDIKQIREDIRYLREKIP